MGKKEKQNKQNNNKNRNNAGHSTKIEVSRKQKADPGRKYTKYYSICVPRVHRKETVGQIKATNISRLLEKRDSIYSDCTNGSKNKGNFRLLH